jgi:UDP-N-acetyl-D-mannosaminuronate dehydrogenase
LFSRKRVIGATAPERPAVAEEMYQQVVVRTVPVSSTRAAEAPKLLENISRAVNIAPVNKLKITFMKMGLVSGRQLRLPRLSSLGSCCSVPVGTWRALHSD